MRTYKLHCEMLSPVHIGTGHEIEPLDYVVKNGRFYRVSFAKLVSGMDSAQRLEFEKIVDSGNLVQIRKLVEKHADKNDTFEYATDASPQIEKLYREKIEDPQNQLFINPYIRTERNTLPLMPGSSIKGAIRTAVISELAKNSGLPKPMRSRDEYEFEAKVLGYKDGKDDPFRGIRVIDKTLLNEDMIIRDVRNVSRKKNGPLQVNNIQILCEVAHSMLTGKPVWFETEIAFADTLYATRFLSKTITVEDVVKFCNGFYRDKMEQEHKKFYKGSEIEKISMQLLDVAIDDTSFLLRVGRFSGVENVTLDNYRNPKPPGKSTVWGTSRNLVEGLYPLGWIKASLQ